MRVLLTVVDHLHIVTSTGLTDPVTAGFALNLGSSSLEDGLDGGPGSGRTTGHERGTVSGTLLTTRDTRADEEEALGLELLGAADGVRVVRVTTIDDDVTRLEVGLKLVDEVVDSGTRLDEKHNFSGLLELCNKLFNRVCALNLGT